ncbi:unnamed protein product [Polarella glacialis]|uniref:Cellulase n=1 Tax=Polarella glacialis TaxID=89957 RepID=A0A813G7H3_POLGL|nr:unnamed protein product [Polarella glacialis]
MRRQIFLLLAFPPAAAAAAGTCAEEGGCTAAGGDDNVLLQARMDSHRMNITEITVTPAVQLPACKVGDHVECSADGQTCSGNQCCAGPAHDPGATHVCPSASPDFAHSGKCALPKQTDCVDKDKAIAPPFDPAANPAHCTYLEYTAATPTAYCMCSDQPKGIINSWKYNDLSAMFPYVSACALNLGWSSAPACGKCMKLTDTSSGNEIYVTCVDGCGNPSNFDIAPPAFDELFPNGRATGAGSATWSEESDYTKCKGNKGPFQ